MKKVVVDFKGTCALCKREFAIPARAGKKWAAKRKFCSHLCYSTERRGWRASPATEFSKMTGGPAHPRWKGGEEITKHGYVKVYAPNHPRTHKGKVFEHVIVMERMIGRRLEDGEVVHHIDHNKENNLPGNLMLFSSHSDHMKYERAK